MPTTAMGCPRRRWGAHDGDGALTMTEGRLVSCGDDWSSYAGHVLRPKFPRRVGVRRPAGTQRRAPSQGRCNQSFPQDRKDLPVGARFLAPLGMTVVGRFLSNLASETRSPVLRMTG